MSVPFPCEKIPVSALLDKTRALHDQGYRLVQINATRLPEKLELTYSFDLGGQWTHLRLDLPPTGSAVPSISSIYWCAFIYENELHDLFDLQISDMAIDFKGTFYQTTVKFPFGRSNPAAAPAAPSPAAKSQPVSAS